MQEAALGAIADGYTHLVYNFVRAGDSMLQPGDECTFEKFDLEKLWWQQTEQRRLHKAKPDFAKLQQFTRLTLVFEKNAYTHQVINMSAKAADKTSKVLSSYDILAVRPSIQAEQVFEQICTRGEQDLI